MTHERICARLPKNAKLLKTDEFSSVFRLRPLRRSTHFVLYARHTGQPARMGIVVGRKAAPRAVSRTLIKRLGRELFRVCRAQFFGWDILLRQHRRLDQSAFPSASSPALKKRNHQEIEALLTAAIRQLTHA